MEREVDGEWTIQRKAKKKKKEEIQQSIEYTHMATWA